MDKSTDIFHTRDKTMFVFLKTVSRLMNIARGHSMWGQHCTFETRGISRDPSVSVSNQIKFYLVTHNTYYVHFITSVVTEEIL